jgi:hypothetical protein
MANDARVAIWSNVPGGAQLRVSVNGTTNTSLVTAKALVLPGNGEKQRLTDAELQPGPAPVSLVKSARRYTVLLDVVYTTDGTAEVAAEVLDGGNRIPPDGSADDHFESTLPGSKGQSLPVTFVVVMA